MVFNLFEDAVKEILALVGRAADSKLYKLDGDKLLELPVTVIEYNGTVPKRVIRPIKDYIGWKMLVIDKYPEPDVYQNVVTYYEEDTTRIYQRYRLENKNTADILNINTDFWNANYIKISFSENDYCFVPKTTTLQGEIYRLLQDDLPLMMMGLMNTSAQITAITSDTTLTDEEKQQAIAALLATPGVVSYLDVYSEPNFLMNFTREYLSSLLVRETDMARMTIIIQTLAGMLYSNREIPTVV